MTYDVVRECLNLLSRMVSLRSCGQMEYEMAQLVQDELEQLKFDTALYQLSDGCCNVVGRLKLGDGGKTLILGGHIDTVAPVSGWQHNPYQLTVEDGRAYGLGALDMKGGLACQLTVLRELLIIDRQNHSTDVSDAYLDAPSIDAISADMPFNGEIVFVALGDEERFSVGAEHFASLGIRADFALLGEPHFEDMVVGSAGKVLLGLEVTGRAGHAARPETGVNAIETMSALLAELTERCRLSYEKGEAGSCCVLKIHGGEGGYSLNIPQSCRALLNKQLMVTEEEDAFIDEIHHIFNALELKENLKMTKERPCYPSYEIEKDNEELVFFRECLKKHGLFPEPVVMQSVSDANILVPRLGIPTLLFGPGGQGLHSADEYVEINSMEKYMGFLKDYIVRFFNRD